MENQEPKQPEPAFDWEANERRILEIMREVGDTRTLIQAIRDFAKGIGLLGDKLDK